MMTKQEFYDELNTAITVGCSLPFSIPEKAIDNILKYAHQWFVRNWDDGVENVYISIPKEVWMNDKNFKQSRTLLLPSCVYSVSSVSKDIASQRRQGGQPDLSIGSYISANWGIGGGYDGLEDTTQSDAVLSYVVAASWGDLTDHIFNYPISFNYARGSNKLFLKGSVVSEPDLLLDCDVRAPLESLYGLDLFFDYCLGQSKMQLANILGTFSMNLPGNATINYDRFYEQGKEQVDDVKEEVKSMRGGSGFFLHTNGM